MHETPPGSSEQNHSPAGQPLWLPKPYVWALAVGIVIIGAITVYGAYRDYRATLTLWTTRLSGEVVSRTWMLRNSLLESHDDTQVLADFASTRELSLMAKGGDAVSRGALLKQVVGLFDEYKKIYEYAAVCLLDPEGRVVVEATDPAKWARVIQTAQVKDFVRAVASNRHYTVGALHISAEERMLVFAMPVFAGDKAGKLRGDPASPVGIVVMLDPLARELIPLLNAEREYSRTGEAVLLWSHEGEGQYASSRRYQVSGSDQTVSPSDTLRHAVRLAVENRVVFGEFLDYRGMAVVAAAEKLPSLDAVVVCKVDRGEAFADFLRNLRVQMIAATATLIVYVGTILWIKRNAVNREMMGRLAQQQAILAERQRTEGVLRAVNATLETRVAERTTQLANANEHLRLELDEIGRAEQALRASEERYRELIENARDIIYTHDLVGKFTSLNRTGERCIGYTREEILGINILQVVGPEYEEFLQQLTQPPKGDREAKTYELEMTSKEGTRLTLEVSPRIIYVDGKPVGVQGIAHDLTERKGLEQQLLQAQKMEAVGRLAGGIAHDFNNLLTIILGYCEELSSQLFEESLKHQLTEIWNAGKRAASLTGQLLAFSRQKAVDPEVFGMRAVVSEMDSMLRRVLGEDVNLTTKLGEDPDRVKADQGQVEQVILNLVVNARDAMPLGGSLTIEMSTADESGAPPTVPVMRGRYVILKVCDTGQGIDARTQALIFDPFFTTKEQGKGTGLGLAMVYGIVKQAGGYVWVDSALGKGTTFSILFPLQEGPLAPEVEPELAPAELPAATETILLVEDEEVLRSLLRKTLEKNGYKVLEARQGDEGLRVVEGVRDPIHLLVTDIVMPQMGGPELARRLTSLHPDTRVLFISGYAGGALGRDPVDLKDGGFLQKPFSPEVFVRKVRELLKQKETGGAVGSHAETPNVK